MPVEGDLVSAEVEGREVRGRIVTLDFRTVAVAYDGQDGVLVDTSEFPLLGVRLPRRALNGKITAEGVAVAEDLLRALAWSDAFVARTRPALEALVREEADGLRSGGAWADALSPDALAAAKTAVRVARRRGGLDQRTARAELRALEERAGVPFAAWRDLLRRVEARIVETHGKWVSRTVLSALVAAAVPWAVPPTG